MSAGSYDPSLPVSGHEAEVQLRRQEAWQCRVMGYWSLLGAVVLFAVAWLVSLVRPDLWWLAAPGVLAVIFGSMAVFVGAMEGY